MKRAPLLLALIALITALFGMGMAHAETGGFADTIGDSASGTTDIKTVVDTYSNGTIGLGLTTVSPEDPNSAFDWTNGDLDIIWTLHTAGGDYDVFYYVWQGALQANITSDSDASTILCDAQAAFSGGIYEAFFPATCIGHPSTISVQGYIDNASSSNNYDFAPGASSFGGTIHETISSTTTTTPPTTTTAPPVDPPVSAAGVHDGYWMLGQSGQVFGFGTANGAQLANSQPFVHIEPTPTGNGYWALTDGGNIIPKGDAAALSSIGVFPGEHAVSISSTPSGKGLWVFTDRGRVVTLGDAQPFGDMSGTPLNGKIVGSVATPTGKGYWMVGTDGGIFSFGDAKFHGSTGSLTLNKPVMAMAPASDNSGYWLVASDGGIFAFDVPFYGSMGSVPLNKPVSGMVPGNGGYMMVAQDGGIFSFGNVAFHGSLGNTPPASPVVSVALQP